MHAAGATHPRISLHQVAFLDERVGDFIAHCQSIGVRHVTLAMPALLLPGALDEAREALRATGVGVACINHPMLGIPDLEGDDDRARAALEQAIAVAADLGAPAIYMLSGARGTLTWEQAATRFAALVTLGKPAADAARIALLAENANIFNADMHIAHSLRDMITLAERADTGMCVDLHGCWMEAGIDRMIAQAMPRTRLVQVSDYVLGDRATPCRAVPGDGAIPLERLIGEVLDAGYQGIFDLELIGPRIAAEGTRQASARAASWLSGVLDRLGA